jgi:hypothetical protein
MFRKTLIIISVLLFLPLFAPLFVENAVCEDRDPSIELFRNLRLYYTETPRYNPYAANEAQQAMFVALREKQYKKALEHAQSVLEKNYVNIDAHFICAVAYKEIGEQDRYKFHQYVMYGLVDSILSSGDGKTPETAYHVISVDEEYAVLNTLGFKVVKQSLMESKGHSYDKMEVLHMKSKEPGMIYFNVDMPLGKLKGKTK